MQKIYYLLTLILCLPIIGHAQEAGYFPISMQCYKITEHIGGNPIDFYEPNHYSSERKMLDSLRINLLLDASPGTFDSVCGFQSNPTFIRMMSFGGPTFQPDGGDYKHTLWYGKICPWDSIFKINLPKCGWAMTLPSDSTIWQDTIKAYLQDIKDNYISTGVGWENQKWAGYYFDEYKQDTNRLYWWKKSDWSRVFDTLLLYAHNYWSDPATGVPSYLRDKFVYSMPPWVLYGNPNERQLCFDTLVAKMDMIGASIFDADALSFRRWCPRRESISSDSFYSYQDYFPVNDMITRYDSCWNYFEKPLYSKTKWHSINQACSQKDTGGANFRWPKKEEVRLQGWLALSRGAKGIRYFSYTTGIQRGGTSIKGLLYYPFDDDNYSTLPMPPDRHTQRTPRSKYATSYWSNTPYDSCGGSEYDSVGDHRIFDWVKSFNDELIKVDTVLAQLRCAEPFNVIHSTTSPKYRGPTPVIPVNSYVRSVYSNNTAYHQNDYFEVANFKCRDSLNDADIFMVVNRYVRPQDTVTVYTKLNYRYPYYLYDISTRSFNGGQQPSRDTLMFDSLKILPGGGRLLKVISDVQVSNYRLSQNVDTTFKEYYSVGNLKTVQCTIKQNSNIRLTSEDGSITLDSNFTVEAGATLLAQVVPHLDGYYQGSRGGSLSSGHTGHTGSVGSTISIEEKIDASLPKVYALSQNYPNPSSDHTTFKYQLPKRSSVSLSIYNIAGQLVKRFDMGAQQPGYYSIKWDASRAANGVYFYKLSATATSIQSGSASGGNAGSFQSVKKMMVLK